MRTALLALLALSACSTSEPPELDVYSPAHGCYAVSARGRYLVSSPGGVAFDTRDLGEATTFRLQPADLATYLLYDADGGYVVAQGDALQRQTELESDMTLVDDAYVSGALWTLQPHARGDGSYALLNNRTGRWLHRRGLTDKERRAARLTLEPTEGCADYPELSLDASGEFERTTWPDGEVYGFADTHSHLLSNFGFGGGMFHGAPFHPLGVEHALGDCDVVHGEMGRSDFFGYIFDDQGNGGDLTSVLGYAFEGELPFDNHDHHGYPAFTDWPDSIGRATHQTQYYKWLERSYLAGLRLVVQHATSNAVVCTLTVGEGWAPSRYDCEDMTAADRQIDGAYAMERYIDAQSGGPGKGWFRIVETSAEAREVIEDGKLAVVLGIEVSDLFNCHLTPREGGPVCDEAHVDAELDRYYERGVRVLFPTHKYDNAFSPGDGSNGFIEVGNFVNSGHYTNKVDDCPEGVPSVFDGDSISFEGLVDVRDDYLAPAPVDFSDIADDPIDGLLEHAGALLGGSIEGEFCQNGTLTDVGEYLIDGMMDRGMIIEVDHLPKWSYVRTFEKLAAADYPAMGTHGNDYNGFIYELGGSSKTGFGRCHDADNPGTSMGSFRSKLARIEAAGGHYSLGFGFDYNGFANGPRPRFGPDSTCTDQQNPVTYPFTSYDGAITFTEPRAGDRVFDYATEGMAHIGLIPEYIQDARNDGVSDEELEPIFRSAEGYLRVWEKSEQRGRERGAR